MIDPGLFEGVENADELMHEEVAGQAMHASEEASLQAPADNHAEPAAAPADPVSSSSEAAAASSANRQRTLFIDADACPVISEALAEARRAGVAVVIAGNTTQNLERHVRPGDPRTPETAAHGFWVDILVASIGADSADFAIVERLQPEDIVVTQDIGLASICLGRGARAIGVRGRIYDPATIDSMLFIRHEEKKARRQGLRTKGPAPFTAEDRRRFTANLRKLLAAH